MTAPVTLGGDYFDAMYEAATDPWGFEDRWYEQRKYAISLALLPERRYRHAFEPGCSIGVLSGMLAGRCDRLLSWTAPKPRSGSPPAEPGTCRRFSSSGARSPGNGPPGVSTSSCSPRSCTTSGTMTWTRF